MATNSTGSDKIRAMVIVDNWRASHSFPLNTFQMSLRRWTKAVDPDSLVAQRIKRLSSTEDKLRRFPTMKLSQMQDIGGCRAVVSSVARVRQLREIYHESDLKHKLVGEKDYIGNPKASGYRGVHLIYRYRSDKNPTYDGHLIEVQLRSRVQHAWATAVETVGTFLKQSLKASQGEDQWLDFFTLMGSAIAIREGSQPVPGTPTNPAQLKQALQEASDRLDVRKKLAAYSRTVQMVQDGTLSAHYFLLDLQPQDGTLTVTGFEKRALNEATRRYLDVEKTLTSPGAEAVLVSVESLSTLRAAFPNYFLDTKVFVEAMDKALH